MPIIQISVRAIQISEPLPLKAGDWLLVMEDDSYRRATKSEAAMLAAGALKARWRRADATNAQKSSTHEQGNGVALQAVEHPQEPSPPVRDIPRKANPSMRNGLDDGPRLDGSDLVPPPVREIQRKTLRLDVAGKTISLSGQMYRVLRAAEAATRATKSATSTTIISQHCLWPGDKQQVAARIIELRQRGFVSEETPDVAGRRQYRPTNNGLALLLASPAEG